MSGTDADRVPTPNWYDVLDVDQDASTAEVRDAWRAAIADLTPADRRFRLYNQAGEVLLDPDRRAAHDADLASERAREESTVLPAPEPASPATGPAAPAAEDDRSHTPVGPVRGRVPRVSTWLLVAVGAVAALVVGLAAYLSTQPSETEVATSVSGARSAAEQAVVPLLSYDFRSLGDSEQAAHDVMTSDYRKRYDQLFAVIEENAPSTRTVVKAETVAAAVVRADAAGDRVEVLVFVDQSRTNRAAREPEVFRNQARLTMQRVGGQWLVDDVVTSPASE